MLYLRMIILGIDPGTAETGYGVIEVGKFQPKADPPLAEIRLIKYGNIKTTIKDTSSNRLKHIHQEILILCQEHKPDVVAIESLFFSINVKSASAVGQSIGVIKLAAALKKIKVFEYPPLKIKMVLVGKGRAKKPAIQSQVRKELRIKKIPRPTHAADALATAICHWKCSSVKIV